MSALNFMILQLEDVGLHFGCYPGNDYSITPNLDHLAAQGTRYDQAFSHSPVCGPSRGGMVTGCYPWTIGNQYMRSNLQNPPRLFTHELVQAGYHVCWPTKLDFNFTPTEGWCTNVEPWWTQDAPDEPFMVYQNMHQTHESRMFEPHPEWHGDDGLLLPDHLQHDEDTAPIPPYIPDCPESRRQVRKYYDALSFVDQMVGERLQWLEDQGKAENTVVIVLSDHGRGLPREKRWCYEAGLHMPLLVRWPDKLDAGSVSDELVGWVDIAPTILSLADVAIPEHYQGQVFLGHDKATPRQYVFAGRDRMNGVFDYIRCSRNQRWHYIRNYFPELPYAQRQWYMENQPVMSVMRDRFANGALVGAEKLFFASQKAHEELYDVDDDPHMLNNLAGLCEHDDVLKQMREALDEFMTAHPDLSRFSEEEHIVNGLLDNRLEDYRVQFEPLPNEQKIGPEPYPFTLNEALQIVGRNTMLFENESD